MLFHQLECTRFIREKIQFKTKAIFMARSAYKYHLSDRTIQQYQKIETIKHVRCVIQNWLVSHVENGLSVWLSKTD